MSIKRTRPTSVCQPCRARKVKCDKSKPRCGNCGKYSLDCIYREIAEVDVDVIGSKPKKLVPPKTDNGLVTAGTNLDLMESQLAELEQQHRLKAMAQSRKRFEFTETELDPSQKPSSESSDKLRVSSLINREPDDMVNLHQFYEAARSNLARKRYHCLLSGASVLQANPLLSMLYDNSSSTTGKDKFINSFSKNISHEYAKPVHVSPGLAGDTRSTMEQIAGTKHFGGDTPEVVQQFKDEKMKMNEKTKLLGLMFFEGELENKIKLIHKIKSILPSRKVISMLLSRFFEKVYPFFSVLDVDEFMANVTRIIGPVTEEENVVYLNLEKRLDFAYMGILLICLRFAYLSIFSNVKSINERRFHCTDNDPKPKALRFLMDNPVNLEVFNVAQTCLNQFNLVGSTNILILQLAFYIRLYKAFAPEFGDESDTGDPHVFSTMLLHLAASMGLHRDPDNFKGTFTNPKENDLRRRIWRGVCLMDLYSCLSRGGPCNSEVFGADTKHPSLKLDNPNPSEGELLSIIIERTCLNYYPLVFDKMRNVLRIVSDVKHPYNISEVDAVMDDCFNAFMSDTEEKTVTSLEDDAFKEKALYYYKTYKLICYFQITRAILVLRFHFLNYYFKNSGPKHMVYYLKTMFHLIYVKSFPVIHEILTNGSRKDDDICDMLLSPGLHGLLYASVTTNLAIILRIKLLLDISPDSSHDISFNLTLYENLMMEGTKVLIGYLNMLGNRYYCAWRDAKLLNFLFEELVKRDLSTTNSDVDTVNNWGLDNPSLTELCDMIESALSYHASHSYSDQSTTVNENNDSLWLLIISLRKTENDTKYNPDNYDDIDLIKNAGNGIYASHAATNSSTESEGLDFSSNFNEKFNEGAPKTIMGQFYLRGQKGPKSDMNINADSNILAGSQGLDDTFNQCLEEIFKDFFQN